MSKVWKCVFFVALCWTLILNTRSYEIIQCSSMYLDTPLCSFDKVASITRVYGGGRLGDSKDCFRTSGDCFLEINSTSHSSTYNEIINNCNGTFACREPLYVHQGHWYGCSGQWIFIKYQVIEYDCIHPNTGSVIKYTTQCPQQYASHPRCPVGKRIVIGEVFGGVNRASVSSSERCRTSSQDCVSLVQSKDEEDITDKCEGKIACDQLFIKDSYIVCGDTTRYWTLMDYVIIQYHCVEYGAGHHGQSTEVVTTTKPSTEITDVIQPTTGTIFTGDDRVINSNEASNGQKMENVKRITFIVLPIVVVIGLVIAITTAILVYKKRMQRKGTGGLGDGRGEVNANALTRIAVHSMTIKAPSKSQSEEMSEASPYTYINNEEDDQLADGNRVPVYENNDFVSGLKSNEDNKASNVTETYAVIDKTKKIKSKTKPKPVVEANLTEAYAVVDKTKKIKSKADVKDVSCGLNVLETYVEINKEKISKAKPEADCEPNLYANVDNRGCDDSGVQPNAEGKHKRHSSVDETVIVDNRLYGKKKSL